MGLPVATVTYYVTVMITSCPEIIGVSFGTITSLIRDKAL